MKIVYSEEKRIFSIQTVNSSYFMQIDIDGVLRNLYFGSKIEEADFVEPEMPSYARYYDGCLLPYRSEFICRSRTCFDEPCVLAEFPDGTRDLRLIYKEHKIVESDKTKTLSVTLRDEFYT